MQINNKNISSELVSTAHDKVKNGSIDAKSLQELKTIALKDGKLSNEESTFISNLDNQTLLNDLNKSDFNPKSFSFKLDSQDKTFTFSNNTKVDIGEGQKVFKDGKIDISSLTNIKQRDNNNNTIGDEARCSCNATVVGLATQGKDKLTDAMSKTLSKYIRENTDKVNTPEYLQKLSTLSTLISSSESGNLTSQDLNTFASILYDIYDTNKSDKIMIYEDVQKMQKELGFNNGNKEIIMGDKVGNVTFQKQGSNISVVASSVDQNSVEFKKAQKNVSEKIIDNLSGGQTSTVSVFNGQGTDKPNHFVLVGKDSAGKVFVYNSDPQANDKYTKTYLEGKEAKEFLANKIGVSLENEVMKNSNTAEYDVKVASPVIK